jgi:glycosyltransferase involved in cell wall biosynthesis
MKFLAYGESPAISTGLGLLSKHILRFIIEMGHEVELCAINHFMDTYDRKHYPYVIHQAPVGEAYNIEKAKALIAKADYDALFLSSDVNQINLLYDAIREAKLKKSFPVIAYSCCDTDWITPQTIAGLTIADRIVMYSKHSQSVIHRFFPALRVEVIYPGCEPDVFKPLPDDERTEVRRRIFKVEDDTFVVLNCNRNQWRKDPGRTMMVFHEFHKRHPNSLLYMHMKAQDIGGNMPMLAGMLGMKLVAPNLEVMFTNPDFNEQQGVNRELLNQIYNAADVFVSTSHGEGFGLTTTDAMAAGTIVIAPRNSSFVEIIGNHEERGYLVESGGDTDHLIVPYAFDCNVRPVVHSDDMIRALEDVYQDREIATLKAIEAYEWTMQHTWEHARSQWTKLFAEIEERVEVSV